MHFIITFGFSIPFDSNTNIKNDKGARKRVVKRKARRRRNRTAIGNESTIESTKSKKNIVNVNEILTEVHVEYEPVPSYTFKFDCRCWETAAKIYTENGDWCLKTKPCPVEENTVWVVFSVHHLVHLNEAQIRQLFNHVITFRMFFGRQKFSERAKKDKVKGFYVHDESIKVEQHDFLEMYSIDYQQSDFVNKPSILPMPEPIIIKDETYGDFSIVTYLDAVPDSMHERKFHKMTRKDRFPSKPWKSELFTTSSEIEHKSTIKKTGKRMQNKRSKKQRKQNEIEHKLHLPTESLFNDMGTITCYSRAPEIPSVSSTLIYAQCEGILSDKAIRMHLNPISIKLEQLSNFPDATVIENDFNYVYARIFFVDRTIVTPYYTPARTIRFEYVKSFFCEEFQAEELIAFLTTKFVTVQIIGVRLVNGTKPMESSKGPEVSTKEELLLGIAEFDVSDLLREFWEVRLTSNLSRPDSTHFTSVNDLNNEKTTISRKNFSFFTTDDFTLFDISVKLKVRVAYDLRTIQEKVLRRDDILNRIFVISNDSKLADEILDHAVSYNYNLSSTEHSDNTNLKVEDTSNHVLTGFVIDCHDKFYIFVEGLSNGYLTKILDIVTRMHHLDSSVYYNSNCVFLKRLYEDFIPIGGVVKVKLNDSLEMQLRECSLYIGETGSTQQAKVFRAMGLMKFTSTMTSLCQSRLLPDPSAVKNFIARIHNIYNS